jgi:hypothetical protein
MHSVGKMNATVSSTVLPHPPQKRPPPAHRIEINLASIEQLFNSMDPSPFHEKDLDRDAEEFLVSWAQEFPRREPITLIIHLDRGPTDRDTQAQVTQAVHHYFAYRARLIRRELTRLLRDGRASLFIGLTFLTACLFTAGLLGEAYRGWNIVREGLTIAGWVAMWRPMEIYLYDWWPLRRHARILTKMSHMEVQMRPCAAKSIARD